jgi:hypothetical protein
MIYEILPIGFIGGVDILDDPVLWVEAGSIEHAKLYAANNGLDPHRVDDISCLNDIMIDLYIDENGEVTDFLDLGPQLGTQPTTARCPGSLE